MSKTKTKQKVSARYTGKRKASSKTEENNVSKKGKAQVVVQKSNDKKSDKIVVSGAKTPKKSKTEKDSKKRGKRTTPLKIIPLGGLDEIGKNLTLYEYEEDIIIVDCGMTFPDEEMLGVDIVIPDFTYIVNNA
ncbi:MAG: ribonuclease J, partial [Clostridia bacterium]|nr:ribonuclease J [Clostridia bacterium]